jgi:predicted transposase/invertase (TIGR01784 family)
MNDSRPLISFDWAIKRLLRQKANYGILEGFLSELLKQDVKISNILESSTNKDDADDKFNQVDILCENEAKELILIELQYDSEHDYFQRISYGTSKILSDHMGKGYAYDKLKKVYSINIVYFELGHGADYVYYGKTEFRGIHKGDVLQVTDTQRSLFNKENVYELFPEIYIIKVDTFNNIAKSTFDEWIYYLKNNELPVGYKAKGLKEVAKKLMIEKLSPEEKANYDKSLKSKSIERSTIFTARYEGKQDGMKAGIEKERKKQEKLREKEKKEQEKLREKERKEQEKKDKSTVQNLLKAGMNNTQIAGIMNISVEEVERLLK